MTLNKNINNTSTLPNESSIYPNTYDIYGLGNALVDTEIEVTDQDLSDLCLEKGLMTLIDETQLQKLETTFSSFPKKQACGGSAANTILAASLFQTQCYYNCKVADDTLGQFYAADLTRNHIATNLNPQKLQSGTTGRCFVLITPDAERTMATYLGITSAIGPEDVHENAIKQSQWTYLEGYLVTSETGKQAAIKAKKIAESVERLVAFTLSDTNIVNYFYDGLKDIIGNGVDLLFCNEDEAKAFTKTDSIHKAIDRLQHMAHSLLITQGKNGATGLYRSPIKQRNNELNTNMRDYNPDDIIKSSGISVKAIDTNGAGDCFAGTFLANIVNGKSPQEASDSACKAAGYVVSHFGPRLHDSFFINS